MAILLVVAIQLVLLIIAIMIVIAITEASIAGKFMVGRALILNGLRALGNGIRLGIQCVLYGNCRFLAGWFPFNPDCALQAAQVGGAWGLYGLPGANWMGLLEFAADGGDMLIECLDPDPTDNTPNRSRQRDGPGEWVTVVDNGMKEQHAEYQLRVAGSSRTEAYKVGTVFFDGYANGYLIEAKGPGYAKLSQESIQNMVLDKLLNQAESQVNVAGGTPIRWYFAEQEAADWFSAGLLSSGLGGSIEVIVRP